MQATTTDYRERVSELEAEGMTTSDAQSVADAELLEARRANVAGAAAAGVDLSELDRATFGPMPDEPSRHRAPEVDEYHPDETGQMHEWAPSNASEQECIRCERGRYIPDDCYDHETVADCYAAGHGGGECPGDPSIPLEAPFALGTLVRYPGPEFQMEGGPWVRIGDVGVVVEIMAPLPDPGDGSGPFHGHSVIEYHGSPRAHRAVAIDSLERSDGSRYEAVER